MMTLCRVVRAMHGRGQARLRSIPGNAVPWWRSGSRTDAFALVSPEVGQVDGDGHVRAMHGRGQAGPFDPRLHVFFGEA